MKSWLEGPAGSGYFPVIGVTAQAGLGTIRSGGLSTKLYPALMYRFCQVCGAVKVDAVLARTVQSYLPGSVPVDPATILSAPPTGGAYALMFDLAEPALFCGPNGSHQIEPGRYVYAGSAYGPGGMRARVGRHFRKSKAIRWHIDHLTQQAGMLQAALIEGGAECNIVRVLVATGEFRIPLKGFGSTDCRRCRSHLLHLRAGGPQANGRDCLA
ncbi:MAG: DUF123 domain-containing protein [Sphingobium sp.]